MSNKLRQIAAAIYKAPHFHNITNNHIKHYIISNINTIIGVFPFFARAIWLISERVFETLQYRALYILNESLRGNRIFKRSSYIVAGRY